MKLFRSIVGFTIAAVITIAVWSALAEQLGLIGGFLAAVIILGPMWFMNHYVGLIDQDSTAAFVDITVAIAICGVMRDTFVNGLGSLISSLPTIVLVITGAILGGISAGLIEKHMIAQHEEQNTSS